MAKIGGTIAKVSSTAAKAGKAIGDGAKQIGSSVSKVAGKVFGKGGVKAITAPTNRNALKNAMGDAPFDGAQAHHGLPWNYKNWFAGKGLNVNDPKYGALVKGGGNGGHQSWSKAYDKVWRDFINRDLDGKVNAKQIKQFYNSIRTDVRWKGGF